MKRIWVFSRSFRPTRARIATIMSNAFSTREGCERAMQVCMDEMAQRVVDRQCRERKYIWKIHEIEVLNVEEVNSL